MTSRPHPFTTAGALPAAFALWLLASTAVYAAPAIRMSETNRVPACVSPERLMDFLKTRNPEVDPRYRDLARWYKHYGEAWNVRWDYAFFQMVLETNYLKYRRGDGRRGDVHEKQFNFAGIGATGGGVAGERFRDVKTGVEAQIQHLVAYSGERVADPVARRTEENQDDIIARSRRLGRTVTFGDLARRWAADRQYAKSIDIVASLFREGHCHGPALQVVAQANVPEPRPGATRSVRDLPSPALLGGPSPQRLAGPEALPWDDGQPVAQDVPAIPQPETGQPAPHAKPSGAVRTLWSRNKEQERAPAGAPREKPVAAPRAVDAAHPSRATVSAPMPEAAAPSPAGTQDTAAAHEDPPAKDVTEISLPHFRIAPAKPEPSHLGGPVVAEMRATAALPAAPPNEERQADPAGTVALAPESCRLLTASYGGKKTLLVKGTRGREVHLTALTVLDGFEKAMFDTYAKAGRPDLELIGTYQTKDAALAEAHRLCPAPKP